MKSNALQLLLLGLLVFLNSTAIYAQINYQSIIPPSPNASELGKYIETPINYYTGVPEISIPLYTIDGKNVSVPISLNYHSGGIEIEQPATWVGLGWSTNSGGLITRVVKGLPDERNYVDDFFSHGLFNSGLTNEKLLSSNANEQAYGANTVLKGVADSESDMFYYNFLGFSGQFFFDTDRNIHMVSQNDLVIQYVLSSDNLTEFTITTTDGNKFIFDQIETSSSNLQYDLPFNSAWYLSQIITQSGNITFTYSEEEIFEKKLSGQTQYIDVNGVAHIAWWREEIPVNSIKCKRLSEISWSGGHVMFTTDLERDDLGHLVNTDKPPKALTKLQVFNQSNELIKEFTFNYSQFENRDCSTDPSDAYLCKRLKLNSLVENVGGIEKPPYIFNYDDTPLPPRNSFAQDFWGYYNGVSNSSLVPNLWAYPSDGENELYLSMYSIYQRSSFNGSEYFLDIGGDRSPDSSYLKAGILKQIQYPTGGFLQFKYEPNDFFFDSNNRTGGGLRIKKTKLFKDPDSPPIIKDYTYNEFDNNTRTSGRIFSFPQYAHRKISPDTPEDLSNLTGIRQGTFIDVHPLGGLGESEGSYVGYKNVTISQPGKGKVEYTLDLPGTADLLQDNCESGECIYNRTMPKTTSGIFWCGQGTIPSDYYLSSVFSSDNYPFAPNPNYGWNRGQVLKEKYFSEENQTQPIKSIEYEYNIKNFEKVPAVKVVNLGYMISSVPLACRDVNDTLNLQYPNGAEYLFYKIGIYDYLSGWKVLTKKKEYLFDNVDNSKYIVSEQDFKYESPQHHFVTQEILKCSDGDEISTDYTYPKDVSFDAYQISNICSNSMDQIEQGYNERVIDCTNAYSDPDDRKNCIVGWWNQYPGVCHDENGNFLRDNCYNNCLTQTLPSLDNEASAISDMVDENMIDRPIQVIKSKGGNVISAEYTKFLSSDNLILPRTTFNAGISEQLSSIPTPSQPYVSESGSLIKSNIFNTSNERIYFDSFDNIGNLLQFHKKDDLNTSYIWGYNRCYPIIKVENVDESTLETAVINSLPIGYNSLEELLTSENGILKMISSAQKRLWRTFCSNLKGQVSLNKARVTIITYIPLVGMTSQTDVNGITTYYEYDAFERLKLIKDNDGNILKTYKYHYRE